MIQVLIKLKSGDMHNIEDALNALKNGQFVIVVDDETRENEGDLILAAEKATPETIAFMVRHTSGIICMPMVQERLNELDLPQMVHENTDIHRTAWTVSVDFRHGTTTGISASDRAKTIQALIKKESTPDCFTRPGHVFPLRYKQGGVLKRAGHTEASIDLAKMAGLYPAGVIGEIVNEDGSMARMNELEVFSKKYDIPLISIEAIIRHRLENEKLIQFISKAVIPTKHGDFIAHVYKSFVDEVEHIALVKGNVYQKENVLVRVHSECVTGDVFGSKRCDCGTQLEKSLETIAAAGSGVLLYLRDQEGRGIGIGQKLHAYNLQDMGLDTVEANLKLGLPVDSREYGIGAQILVDLGLSTIHLMTNNPAKYTGLAGYDLKITDRIPLSSDPNPENLKYLMTKQTKMGHLLNLKD